MNRLLIIIFSLLITSCGGWKQARQAKKCAKCVHTDSVQIVEKATIVSIVRDSIITLPPDSAYIKLWLECDSLGKVQVKASNAYESGALSQSYTLVGNVFNAECKIDSQQVAIQWLETNTSYTKYEKNVEIKYVPAPLTEWQTRFIKLGKLVFIFIVLGVSFGLFYLLRKFNILKKL